MKKYLKFLSMISVILATITMISCNAEKHQTPTEAPTVCEHDFSSWQITKYQTCVEKGVKEGKCAKCGEVKTEEILPSGVHSYGGFTVTNEATCTNKGLEVAVCKNCGETSERDIEATGHTYSEWIDVVSKKDCVTPGKRVRYCENCDDAIEKTVYGNHDYKDHRCTICNQEATKDITYEISVDGQSYSVSGIDYFSTAKKLIIMDIYNGLPVTSISSLDGNVAAEELVIPITVTDIAGAIMNMSRNLKSITVEQGNPKYHSDGNCLIDTEAKKLVKGCGQSAIPTDGSVTVIGKNAFGRCDGITAITIPEGVTAIEELAFEDCSKLKSVTLPETLVTLDSMAFMYCTSLEDIIIPASVTNMGHQIFLGCRALREIKLSAGVGEIKGAFAAYCQALETIIFSGTKAEWQALPKAENWDNDVGSYTVYCTDGELIQ